ncbi:hypothetical protein [Exiguobacterium sp.]|uniref:hypothetical protein n=1 Tax=Exiguobacterium sp. TaxID=44751 RepID=UPI00263B0A1A|nr:hypothetical protein [Exiguobacterium sp.]MCC5892590.1 hypothetical protein [Exiguobacterium sp.]
MRLLASLISLGFACLISLELWQLPFVNGWMWGMPLFFLGVSFFQFMKHVNELEWNETK